MQLRLVPLTLLAGVAAAVGTVATYQDRLGLALGVVTSLLLVAVSPPGWGSRLPYGLGYAATVALLSVNRGEGDYLISSSVAGYAVLAVALVVLTWSIATLPRPGRAEELPERTGVR